MTLIVTKTASDSVREIYIYKESHFGMNNSEISLVNL